ncbi:hypothetical protein B0T13DRAFT_325644 [Neurospora crassa]|nr:hypothetical protein B0T13DRAFT_325644 [Neurospora crassa]
MSEKHTCGGPKLYRNRYCWLERHPLRSLHEAVATPGSSGQFVRFLHLINLEGVVPLLFWARASLSRAMPQRPDTWKGRVSPVQKLYSALFHNVWAVWKPRWLQYVLRAQLAQVHLSARDYVPHLYILHRFVASGTSVGNRGTLRRGHHFWLVQPHSLLSQPQGLFSRDYHIL